LTSGVRMARVMTMSSAFLEVLQCKVLSAKSSYFFPQRASTFGNSSEVKVCLTFSQGHCPA
jgi:hypothetical protein